MINKKTIFNDVYNDFNAAVKLTGSILSSEDRELWLERSMESHAGIQEAFGANTLEIKVNLDKEFSPTLDREAGDDFGIKFESLIPKYFIEYGLHYTHFRHLTFPMGKKPQLGMAWTKHIAHWMSKNPVDPEVKKKVNKLLCELGNAHTMHKTGKDEYYVTISFEPQSFYSLGQSNVDLESCFKTNGLNEVHKYIIGQNPNTFVGFVSKNPITKENLYEQTLMRFWGIADLERSRFNVCNIYPRYPKEQANIYKSIFKAFEELIGEPTEITPLRFRVTGVFFNKESATTYHKKDVDLGETTEIIHFDHKGVNKYRKCLCCGGYTKSEDVEYKMIDYGHFCDSCYASTTKKCGFSGEPCRGEMIRAFYKDKYINISEVSYYTYFRECSDGVVRHLDDIVKVGKQYKVKPEKKQLVEESVDEETVEEFAALIR